ncbi:hypothetical protein ScPMuIL_018160 [Solemya velum]
MRTVGQAGGRADGLSARRAGGQTGRRADGQTGGRAGVRAVRRAGKQAVDRMLTLLPSLLTLKSVIIGAVAGLLGYWLIRRMRYKLPPGPLPIPLIGNLLQLKDCFWHEKFHEWAKKHGPVISVYMGPQRWTILNTIEVVHEALVTKANDFANRPKTPSTDVFTDGGKDIALGEFGPCWRLHRKISSNALRHYMMGEHLELRIHNAVDIVSNVLTKEKEAVDPKKYVDFLVFNIICGFCYGKSYDIDDPEFLWIMNEMDTINKTFGDGMLEDIVPLLQYFPTQSFRKLEKDLDALKMKAGYEKFREHENTFDPDNIRDFTDCLIKARKEAEEEEGGQEVVSNLTETHLVQTLMDIFFAGFDTTRFTTNWVMLHMAAFPEIQAKVHEEIDRVVGKERPPQLADRPRLSYTEAVLHESMRLGTAVPLGLIHTTTCNTTVGGCDVPKGSMVAINHWALHHDPDAWKEPNRFIPERFLNEDGKLGPKPKNWLPFSAGRRVCLGESVAKPELHLVFASLMQKFKVRMPLGIHADLSSSGNSFSGFPKPNNVLFEART